MAKQATNVSAQVQGIVQEVKSGIFKPVYLLMGEEPYYPDMVCKAILDNAVEEDARDFDQFVFYGLDADADSVITAARGYSMFGGRVLVVVKEAQLMKELEELAMYCANPLDSTVLVVLLHGASVDKRKAFYKSVQKIGVIVDSPAIKDYEIASWIMNYYSGRGLSIDPQGAQLLAEYAGTSISTIEIETDKLLKNLPEGCTKVSVADIEKNVGISRQFSIFELTRELSMKNASKAVSIATHIGSAAKFAMPMATSALYTHFSRILRFEALLMSDRNPDQATKAKVLGVSPYFFREYDTAVRNYPMRSTMAVMSLLSEYDGKGKGVNVGPETTQGELLVELVLKILSI